MATGVQSAKIALRVDVTERKAVDLGTLKLPHLLENTLQQLAEGTTDGTQIDRVWSDQRTVTNGVADAIDLLGTLTAADGTAISFVDVAGIFIQHVSGAGDLQIGATNANPFVTWLGASGDYVRVGPNGFLAWFSPNGKAPTASTGDILEVISSSGSVVYNIVVIGRSA